MTKSKLAGIAPTEQRDKAVSKRTPRRVRDANSGQFLVSAKIAQRLVEKGALKEEIYKIVVPRRTLDRRNAEGGMLSADESDRAIRLERIFEHADRVFGDPEKARRWLRKPNRALDGAVPIELLVSETGARIVEEELHAIDHGMYV